MNQQSLWETKEVQEGRTIYIPDETTFSDCQRLMGTYRVAELRPMFLQLSMLWDPSQLEEGKDKKEQALAGKMKKLMKERTSLCKSDLQYAVAFFVADERNVALFLDALPADERELWRCVVTNYYAGKPLLKRTTGKEWLTKSYYYVSDILPAPLHWFYVCRGSDYQYYLTMRHALRTYFYPYFLGARRTAGRVDALPEGTTWHTFHAENEMPRLLKMLEVFHQKEELTHNIYDKMKWTTARKVSKSLKLREFFPDSVEKNASSLRALLLMDSFAYCRWKVGKEQPIEKMAKQVFIEYSTSSLHLSHTLLPHVSGIRQTVMDWTCFDLQTLHISLSLEKICTDEGWTDIDQLLAELYFMETNNPNNLLFSPPAIGNMRLHYAKLTKAEIPADKIYQEVSVPFVKGFLFLLAAWGILEIAYQDMDLRSPSYYDSLRYFRFTELGRYLMGRTPHYVSAIAPESGFELDEERLLFRSLNNSNPYETLVTEIAEPIGGHRFRLTEASFLKTCSTAADLEKSISFFHRYVCQNPPPVWEDFFSRLRAKAVPWTKMSPRKFEIYQLPTDNAELLRLLSSDEVLRKYVRRAEGYMVLVETTHIPEVKQRLKSFGFLL